MSATVDINKLFELIDLYKYSSVKGEKVELIVTPYEVDGKWDDSKRLVTIGIQGGISRDRDTFVVNSSNVFDDIVLPQILSYFTQNDTLLKWDIAESDLKNITSKGVIETESGNVFYLETFNNDLFEEVIKEKKDVDKNVTYKDDFLTENDKIWDEIILYANRRRVLQDFYKGNNFSSRDQDNVYKFIVNVAENKRGVSSGVSTRDRVKNEKFIDELFKDKKKLLELGLSDRLINKILDTSMVSKIANLVGAEKRIRKRLDLNNSKIKSKVEFATTELDKVNYFDLKNASAISFERGKFTSSQPAAILKLKQLYSVRKVFSKTVTDEYKTFCDEILTYLENKSLNNRRIVTSKIKTPLTEFEYYDSRIVDDYSKFRDMVDVVINGKLDLERYEIIVEPGIVDPKERYVRISLMDGVSRNDTFKFLFTDGEKFDEELLYIMKKIEKDDPNFKSTIRATYNGDKLEVRTALHESRDDNEVIIKHANDNLAYRKTESLVDKFKKVKEDIVKEKKRKISKEKTDKTLDIIAQLKQIEKSISDEAKIQDEMLSKIGIVDDSTASFEQLHYYATNYKIGDVDNKLTIYDRTTGKAYNAFLESEKRNIEFAIYWSVMAGINESDDDVVFGEKYAFNEDNKKLFNIMDIQFKESLRRGIPIDMESLKKQFIESDVPNAEKIYDRLFKNNHYINYVKTYYKKSLNSLKDSIKKSADVQAQELIKKRERAESMSANSKSRKIQNDVEFDELKEEAEKYARDIQSSNEKVELKEAAEAFAKEIQRANEQADLKEAAEELARKIQNDNEIEVLKVEAEEYAKDIHEANQRAEIKEAAEEYAKDIQQANERAELKEAAEEFAREIAFGNEQAEIKEAAKEYAKDIQKANEIAEIKEAAKEYAKDIEQGNELLDIKKAADRYSKVIQNSIEATNTVAAAKEYAQDINDEIEREKMKEAADQYAKDINGQNQYAEIVEAAEEFARQILEANENEKLKEAALKFAKEIQEANEKIEIKEAAEVFAKEIQQKNEMVDLKEAAEECARGIHARNQYAEILEAADQYARDIQQGNDLIEIHEAAEQYAKDINGQNQYADILNAAEQYAKDIQQGNELAEIKEIAKEYAKDIQHNNDIIFLKEGAREQAKMLVGDEELAKANIVEKDPQVQELIDAYEVIETYATKDRPTSIKIFFEKGKEGQEAEVILSNGIGADETVMYRKEFDINRLQGEIIPLVCDLYADSNEVVYNKSFEVPNTNKGGLVVVGKQEKTFQVSNADKTFISFCQSVLAESLEKNDNEITEITK